MKLARFFNIPAFTTATILVFVVMLSFFWAINKNSKHTNKEVDIPIFTYTTPVANESRVALVIGNNKYQYSNISPLKSAVNDADLFSAEMDKRRLSVIRLNNATHQQMVEGVENFANKLSTNSIGVVYYSGHGVQIGGDSYLLSIDLPTTDISDVKKYGINLSQLLKNANKNNPKFILAIIDACRDELNDAINPVRFLDLVKHFWFPMDKPNPSLEVNEKSLENAKEIMIVYAAGIGQEAVDGLFTRELVRVIRRPYLSISDAMDEVVESVKLQAKRLKKNQIPAIYKQVTETTLSLDPPRKEPKRRVEPLKPEMVVIQGGNFLMGSADIELERENNEGPRCQINVPKFEIGKYEVTFDEWDACVNDGGCDHEPEDQGWGRGLRPVINVSWEDVQKYLAWLNLKTSKQYRLPTESEWEYAARAGTATPFYTGDCISVEQANFDDSQQYSSCASTGTKGRNSLPTGSFPANAFGLYDMAGNVWEWITDCWHDSYDGAPIDGSAWINNGDCNYRVSRSGSWFYIVSWQRAAIRLRDNKSKRFHDHGFRLAHSISSELVKPNASFCKSVTNFSNKSLKGHYPGNVFCEFGGRVGGVIFTNHSLYTVKVKLWHPDNQQIHEIWTVPGSKSENLEINVGDDWGVQLGGSRLKCIGQFAKWKNHTFLINTSNFYK